MRKRSSVLVDDDLLIDLGPDLLAAAQQHGVVLKELRYCLQTHEHPDHLYPWNLDSRSMPPVSDDVPRMGLYATKGALRETARVVDFHAARNKLEKTASGARESAVAEDLMAPGVGGAGGFFNVIGRPVKSFESLTIGSYHAIAVPAAHDDPALVTALLWVLERDGATFFYCTDTGPLPEESWEALVKGGYRFDLVAMDHTFGFGARSTGHMNAEQFAQQLSRMRSEKLVTEDTRVFATHLAHHSNPPHPEIAAAAAAAGYEVAYDGLVVEVGRPVEDGLLRSRSTATGVAKR